MGPASACAPAVASPMSVTNLPPSASDLIALDRLSAAMLIATCFTQEQNTDRAIEWWRTVLRLSPGHQGALNSLRLLGVENP